MAEFNGEASERETRDQRKVWYGQAVDLHFEIFPVFEAEIRDQLKEIDKVYQRVEKRSQDFKTNPERTESLSYQLHNLYCAFEDLFRIVAEHFENSITDRERWHAELLKRMKIEVKGIRPAFISEESYVMLDKLRAFRHRFRHAYTYELDPDEIELVLGKVFDLRGIYQGEAERFLNLIKDKVFTR